jgi:histidinol-phosphatase (PHP family)
MPIRCDYHMHTPRCKHAAGPMEAYVERAIALGLREVGFSDHNPLPDGLASNVRMDEAELDDYVADVLRLRDRYRGQIAVKLGIEMDYLEGLEPYLAAMTAQYPWDYVIGSVHYLDPQCRQGSWPRNFAGSTNDLYRRYLELMRRLAGSGLFDIAAHFDVAKRSGRSPTAHESDDIARTLDEIKRAGLCMEINTSGYRHPELARPEPYPSLSIVAQALALGIPLTVNSDAHAPDQVGLQFLEIETFLLAHGCRSLCRYERRKRTRYPLRSE